MAKRVDFVKEAEEGKGEPAVDVATLDAKLRTKVTMLVETYLDAHQEEKIATEKKKDAGAEIKEIVETHGFKRLVCQGSGKISYVEPSERTSFGKDDLVNAMLGEGLDVATINKVLNKAAKKTTTQGSIRISPWKDKE